MGLPTGSAGARQRLKRLLPMVPPLLRALRNFRQARTMKREYTPDRHVLENVIFETVRESPELRRVLFVGVDFYTRHYPALFAGHDFSTIDFDPDKARYGAPRHVVDSLEHLGRHFAPASLDAIICTGVFGWGLNGRAETERAIAACFECLRPGGIFVIGWSDYEGRRPVPLDTIESLRRFEPVALPPFPGAVYPTFSHHRHQFEFYARPE